MTVEVQNGRRRRGAEVRFVSSGRVLVECVESKFGLYFRVDSREILFLGFSLSVGSVCIGAVPHLCQLERWSTCWSI